MKLTVQVKLVVTPDQTSALIKTMAEANACCNRLSEWAWQNQTFGQYSLHKARYAAERAASGLTAQVVVRCYFFAFRCTDCIKIWYNCCMEIKKTRNNFGDFWSDEDLALLCKEYPIGGIRRVSELLPNRSPSSIRTKASRMHLKRPECDRGAGFNQSVFDNMTPTEAAYFAGFFDGEGYISLTKTHRLSVSVSNTNQSVIERHTAIIGGMVKIRSRNNPRQRNISRWDVSGQRAMMFLEKIAPYLLVKKEEAELAIKYQKEFIYTSRKITPEIFQKREAVKQQLSELKGRIK